jgi:hypothetical protein
MIFMIMWFFIGLIVGWCLCAIMGAGKIDDLYREIYRLKDGKDNDILY